MKRLKQQTRALGFVTNELLIVLGLFGLGLLDYLPAADGDRHRSAAIVLDARTADGRR